MKKIDLIPVLLVFVVTIGLLISISKDLYKTIQEITGSYGTVITVNHLKPPK